MNRFNAIFPLLALALAACTANTQPQPLWSKVLYAHGQVYVLSGTERNVSMPGLGVAGFEVVTRTAERNLTLRRYLDKSVVLDGLVQTGKINEGDRFQFLPDQGALLAILDTQPGSVVNLVTHRRFVAPANFYHGESESYRLCHDILKDNAPYFIFNKLTGVSLKLTPEATAFVESHRGILAFSYDGDKFLGASIEYSPQGDTETVTVEAWDLKANKRSTSYPPRQIERGKHDRLGNNEVSWTQTVITAGNEALAMIFTRTIQENTEVHEALFSQTGCVDRILSASPAAYFDHSVQVFNDSPTAFAILTPPPRGAKNGERRQTLEQFDTLSGAKLKSTTIVLPSGG